MPPVSRGFKGRRPQAAVSERLPPGQYLELDFPVLSAGPTPRTPLEEWSLTVAQTTWTWEAFRALPSETITTDIHCVTKWSKLGTTWEGVSLDVILEAAGGADGATHLMAHCDGDYTTNLPLADVTGGKAWIAPVFEGAPLAPEHGGPARLLVPHLYFWKSAKWVRGLELLPRDAPGFWEALGYHDRGDPWQEQRYQGD